MVLDLDITLQKITEECQRMLNIKHNNFAIEEKDISRVHVVRPKLKSAKDDVKPFPCSGCGGRHFKKDCYSKNKVVFVCSFCHKSTHCRRKNKNLKKNKNGIFKNKKYSVSSGK